MGLLKLAVIGGAGYWAVKKINENKNGKQCNRNRNNNSQDREINDYNPSQQYHDYPEKQMPQNQNRSQNNLPQYQEPYYRYEPQYRDQPNATYDYPNEKGGVREIKN